MGINHHQRGFVIICAAQIHRRRRTRRARRKGRPAGRRSSKTNRSCRLSCANSIPVPAARHSAGRPDYTFGRPPAPFRRPAASRMGRRLVCIIEPNDSPGRHLHSRAAAPRLGRPAGRPIDLGEWLAGPLAVAFVRHASGRKTGRRSLIMLTGSFQQSIWPPLAPAVFVWRLHHFQLLCAASERRRPSAAV
jgi:hypothetical protein